MRHLPPFGGGFVVPGTPLGAAAIPVVPFDHPDGKEGGMTGSAGTQGRGDRRMYVTPFVRNLDVDVTGNKSPSVSENVIFSSNGGPAEFLGPS